MARTVVCRPSPEVEARPYMGLGFGVAGWSVHEVRVYGVRKAQRERELAATAIAGTGLV
jgi:hypothetical protein